jgi:hypothetical protein
VSASEDSDLLSIVHPHAFDNKSEVVDTCKGILCTKLRKITKLYLFPGQRIGMYVFVQCVSLCSGLKYFICSSHWSTRLSNLCAMNTVLIAT